MKAPTTFDTASPTGKAGFFAGGKSSDVPQGGNPPDYATGWNKFRFLFTGYFACLFTGHGDRFAALVSQAGLETGGFASGKWKRGAGAWCMQYSKTGTPKATGADTSGEPTAIYTGWFRNIRMWSDRIRWDVKRGIRPGTFANLSEYQDKVLEANWRGYNVPPSVNLAYKVAWTGVHGSMPSYLKAVGGVDTDGMKGKLLNFVIMAVCVGLVAWCLWLLWKHVIKRK